MKAPLKLWAQALICRAAAWIVDRAEEAGALRALAQQVDATAVTCHRLGERLGKLEQLRHLEAEALRAMKCMEADESLTGKWIELTDRRKALLLAYTAPEEQALADFGRQVGERLDAQRDPKPDNATERRCPMCWFVLTEVMAGPCCSATCQEQYDRLEQDPGPATVAEQAAPEHAGDHPRAHDFDRAGICRRCCGRASLCGNNHCPVAPVPEPGPLTRLYADFERQRERHGTGPGGAANVVTATVLAGDEGDDAGEVG